jgi:WD40 repeat protein
MQLSAAGGNPLPIPSALGDIRLVDVSPVGTELLAIKEVAGEEGPLWIVPVPSGTPRRVGNVGALDASFSADGKKIAYVQGKTLFEVMVDGSGLRKLLTHDIPIEAPHWSPDSRRLRYTAIESGQQASLWEADAEGKNPHRLFPASGRSCWGGSWTPDGRYFLFACNQNGELAVWAAREKSSWFTE